MGSTGMDSPNVNALGRSGAESRLATHASSSVWRQFPDFLPEVGDGMCWGARVLYA